MTSLAESMITPERSLPESNQRSNPNWPGTIRKIPRTQLTAVLAIRTRQLLPY